MRPAVLVSHRLALGFMTLFLVFSVACFGGGGESGEIGLIEFEAEPTQVPEDDGVDRAFSVDGEVLDEINFLYGYEVLLEDLVRLNHDFVRMAEYDTGVSLGLDWVIDVHNVTREADELFSLVLSQRISHVQRERHGGMYLRGLEIIQVLAYGSDRLMAAALEIGPSGRDLEVMSQDEVNRFQTFVREAGFFFRDADELLELQVEEVGARIGEVGLR